jgi:cell division protein FtsB
VRFHRILLLSAVAVVLLMAMPPARQLYGQYRRITVEKEKLAALRDANSDLEQELERLKSPDYLERLAREQLGMVKPGETAYVVVRPNPSEGEKAPHSKPKPWYLRAWEWLVGLVPAD